MGRRVHGRSMLLSEVPIGAVATVEDLRVQGLLRRRLLDLGFTRGAKVEVVRRSPFGDPRAYRIRGTTIALRNADAATIAVVVGGDDGWE